MANWAPPKRGPPPPNIAGPLDGFVCVPSLLHSVDKLCVAELCQIASQVDGQAHRPLLDPSIDVPSYHQSVPHCIRLTTVWAFKTSFHLQAELSDQIAEPDVILVHEVRQLLRR